MLRLLRRRRSSTATLPQITRLFVGPGPNPDMTRLCLATSNPLGRDSDVTWLARLTLLALLTLLVTLRQQLLVRPLPEC